jgi:hypothetical protein
MARTIQDEEITDMIAFFEINSGLGRVIISNTCAMLRELLLLRKKLRDAQ